MSIFTSVAVSPSGTTLLNALQVTTAAGTVLNEGVTLVDSANPANVGSVLASGAILVEPGGVNTQPITGTVTANQATAANFNAQVVGPAAAGASATGNPLREGCVFNTTQPTVTTGQIVDLQGTARGGLIVATGVDALSITSTSAQTITAVQATPASLKGLMEVWDGTNTAAVKAASTAAAAADPALVVAVSPNNTIPTNLTQIAGSAIVTANAGIQKVGISGAASGSTLDAVITPAAAPPSGLAILSQYQTSPPAPTSTQTMVLQSDYSGSIFVKPFRRKNTGGQATTISNTSTATTIVTAQAANIFADIATLVVTATPGATASTGFTATLSDGTTSYIYDMQTGAVATAPQPATNVTITFNPPLPATTAATAWTLALSVATVTVHVTVGFVLQKAS